MRGNLEHAERRPVESQNLQFDVSRTDAAARFNAAGIVVDDPLARARPELIAVAWTLFEQKRPLRVLQCGAGEGIDHDLTRELHQFFAALAAATKGSYEAIVHGTAAQRLGVVDQTARLINAAARPRPLEKRAYDLVLLSPVDAANERHSIHAFWSFLEVESFVAENGVFVLGDCKSNQGDRADNIATYFQTIGQRLICRGADTIWVYRPLHLPILHTEPIRGVMEPLQGQVEFKRTAFFRFFDQVFSFLLGERAGSFRRMFEHLLSKPGPYTIIETGTTRPSGDFLSNGQSTVMFDMFVNFFGGRVISIDINAGNVFYASTKVSQQTTIHCADSVSALKALPEVAEAQLIYLDSYDFDKADPHPSSFHHLQELAAIQGRTRTDCMLVIDDCFGPNHGKHAYVARYLESIGNNPLYAGYHTAWMLS